MKISDAGKGAPTENDLRRAVGPDLAGEFSRARREDGKLYAVCSEAAAQKLRDKALAIGVDSLQMDEGRTKRFRLAHGYKL